MKFKLIMKNIIVKSTNNKIINKKIKKFKILNLNKSYNKKIKIKFNKRLKMMILIIYEV